MSLTNNIFFILILVVLSYSVYPVAGEVTTLSIATDNTWKTLDFENDGWTSNNYDDSWWKSAEESTWSIESGKGIWYPGELAPKVAYFRNTFEIGGTQILNGKLHVKTYNSDGVAYLYINDNPIEKINYETGADGIDITSYLKPGKNVIAAKVSAPGYSSWALVGTIRYDKSASGQPIT